MTDETEVVEDEETSIDPELLNELIHSFRNQENYLAFTKTQEVLREQVKVRENMILTMELESVNDLIKLIVARGERLGLKLALMTPETILENLVEAREMMEEENENTEE